MFCPHCKAVNVDTMSTKHGGEYENESDVWACKRQDRMLFHSASDDLLEGSVALLNSLQICPCATNPSIDKLGAKPAKNESPWTYHCYRQRFASHETQTMATALTDCLMQTFSAPANCDTNICLILAPLQCHAVVVKRLCEQGQGESIMFHVWSKLTNFPTAQTIGPIQMHNVKDARAHREYGSRNIVGEVT